VVNEDFHIGLYFLCGQCGGHMPCQRSFPCNLLSRHSSKWLYTPLQTKAIKRLIVPAYIYEHLAISCYLVNIISKLKWWYRPIPNHCDVLLEVHYLFISLGRHHKSLSGQVNAARLRAYMYIGIDSESWNTHAVFVCYECHKKTLFVILYSWPARLWLCVSVKRKSISTQLH